MREELKTKLDNLKKYERYVISEKEPIQVDSCTKGIYCLWVGLRGLTLDYDHLYNILYVFGYVD